MGASCYMNLAAAQEKWGEMLSPLYVSISSSSTLDRKDLTQIVFVQLRIRSHSSSLVLSR